jgi:ribosomal protein L40E
MPRLPIELEAEIVKPDWICSKCGAEVPGNFEVCWECGTSVDGVKDPSFPASDED